MLVDNFFNKKTNLIISLFFAFILPTQVWAADGAGIADRKDNIPPRATLGRAIATGPVGFNTIDVSSGKEVIYRTFFNEQLQIGDVVYENVSDHNKSTESRLPRWQSPAARLLGRDWKSRQIYTTKVLESDQNSVRDVGIPFTNESLTQWQKDQAAGLFRSGPDVINYTRGDRGNEFPNGGDDYGMRARLGILGEIVNSGLYLVNYPKITDPGTTEPLSMLYVGANDGMLHAFNAKTGEEVFAYVPSSVIPNLKENTKLRPRTSGDVLLPKPAYVDGQIAVARVSSIPGQAVGGTLETVLVGTLGAGGEGLYALNVTNPFGGGPSASTADKANNIVKWEVTGNTTGYANMGRIYGAPRIAVINVDSQRRNVVIVGNGYYKGGDGIASLFIIDLETGKLIREIVADQPGLIRNLATFAMPFGLSTPTVYDENADGVVDFAYAGDTGGQLWRFDLNVKLSESYPKPIMLYRSKAREGTVFDSQKSLPITTPPFVHVKDGKRMVIFGTGILTRTIHHTTNLKNRLYGIYDKGKTIDDNNLDRVILRDGAMYGAGNADYRYAVDGRQFWGKKEDGWFMSLIHGDRLLGFTPVARSGLLYFTTNTPTVTNTFDPSWFHVVDMSTGLAPDGVCSLFDRDKDNVFCNDARTIPDFGDLLPIERIDKFFDETNFPLLDLLPGEVIPNVVNLMARDRKLMGMKIKIGDSPAQGAVSQPVLLTNAQGVVYPIFNWNTTGLQNTFDYTRDNILEILGDTLRDSRYITTYDPESGETKIEYQMELWVPTCRRYGPRGEVCILWGVEKEFRTAEQTIIKKDGSWHYRQNVGGLRLGGLGISRCIANCTGGDKIAGVIGNNMNSDKKMELKSISNEPDVTRRSWRVIEE